MKLLISLGISLILLAISKFGINQNFQPSQFLETENLKEQDTLNCRLAATPEIEDLESVDCLFVGCSGFF